MQKVHFLRHSVVCFGSLNGKNADGTFSGKQGWDSPMLRLWVDEIQQGYNSAIVLALYQEKNSARSGKCVY
jgi:hypothetical protein